LIAPVEGQHLLSGIHTLIIVPHGMLNYLSFAALPGPRNGASSFLVERYDVMELPAANLVKAGSAGAPAERLISFAPSRSGLKFAVPEAQDVARIFGPNGKAFTGAGATKKTFEDNAPHFDIVHVATHGFFNKMNPILSGLQLEPGGGDDGRLEIHDILQMHLKARLVTLSACDTALGASDFAEIPAGDEFVGLNRAFLEAGSDAVIASLWKVSDQSTPALMGDLYRSMKHERASVALARAQRAMIRSHRYSSPYYWAPFVFMGVDLAPANIRAEKN
jgi:CHAT domain-containing protein